MRKRKELGNSTGADIVVSIHQNAFSSQSVKGPQVFYYKGSENSQALAECIQTQLNDFAVGGGKRLAKENSSYYILKEISAPSVIVECGFLSNFDDENKLNTQEYQERIAWAIYMGIENYFGQEMEIKKEAAGK